MNIVCKFSGLFAPMLFGSPDIKGARFSFCGQNQWEIENVV